jgi:hypothetical protein
MADIHYVVRFRNPEDGQSTELKVRSIGDSHLGPGFICLSDFVFRDGAVVVPSEQALRDRYANTRRLHLNVFAIQSIAEEGAEHPGLSLETDRSNLVVLPGPKDG